MTSKPALPGQREQIKRKAKDAGLTLDDLRDLSRRVCECEWENLSMNDAQLLTSWLLATGPEKARSRLYEMRGERKLF